tara:strand:- start:52 stop:837 length:786 start_codon:yes stop_codon:yes gene_type:complete
MIQSADFKGNLGLAPTQLRSLDCFALVYVYRGFGRYQDELGVERRFEAGDLLLLFPGVAHCYSSETAWDELFTMFKGPQFDLLWESGLLDASRPIWRLQPVEYWKKRLLEAISDRDSTCPDTPTRINRLVTFIIDAAAAQNHRAAPDQAWVRRARREIDTRLSVRPDYQAVAECLGMSYENFRKRFSRMSGEAPGRYAARVMNERAVNLLRKTNLGVGQIADALGYCDAFHFSKQFKQHNGLSPRAFRNALLSTRADSDTV